jgi:uncharacterized protein YjbI with pentapeptide repeats
MDIVRKALFSRGAHFGHTVFGEFTDFEMVTFAKRVDFTSSKFRTRTFFDHSNFDGEVQFSRSVFEDRASFHEANFAETREFGPMLVKRQLDLNGATFQQRVQIEAAALALCARRIRFPSGAQLRVRWAQVVLDDADFSVSSTLTGVPPFAELDENRFAKAWERLLRPIHIESGRPRVLSLRRADLSGLRLSNVDLRACRFFGAQSLDRLRIEAEDAFGYPPTGWRWTQRQAIAEEHHWRRDPESVTTGKSVVPHDGPTVESRRGRGWYRAAHRPPRWLQVEWLQPAQLAVIYRALRKGREDAKDEPGAADFYYGEMEMRRQAKRREARLAWRERQLGRVVNAEAEHVVLWLYWVLSGYALRASRALAWLVSILAVATIVLAAVGLEQPTPASFPARMGTSFLVALEGAVFRASEQALTYVGRLVQAGLRFVGPVLLGLAVLSVRGRVKR